MVNAKRDHKAVLGESVKSGRIVGKRGSNPWLPDSPWLGGGRYGITVLPTSQSISGPPMMTSFVQTDGSEHWLPASMMEKTLQRARSGW